jgi:hypothetical protein
MLVVNLPIPDPKNPPALKFSPRCVHCGQPTSEVLPLNLPMGVEKRSKPVMLKLEVPLCTQGAKLERKLAKVTLIPFLVGGLLMGLIACILTWLLVPDLSSSTSREAVYADWIIAGSVGLIVAIITGSLVEMAFKLLFAPVYGKMLFKRPLTAMEIFSNTENVLGLSAALSKDKKQLTLTFEREEVGREFQHLNL